VLYGHVGRAAIKSRIKIMSNMVRMTLLFTWRVSQMSRTISHGAPQSLWPTRMFSPALGLIGIVWDSAVTRRLAILMLIIVIVCFSLALLFFLRRR